MMPSTKPGRSMAGLFSFPFPTIPSAGNAGLGRFVLSGFQVPGGTHFPALSVSLPLFSGKPDRKVRKCASPTLGTLPAYRGPNPFVSTQHRKTGTLDNGVERTAVQNLPPGAMPVPSLIAAISTTDSPIRTRNCRSCIAPGVFHGNGFFLRPGVSTRIDWRPKRPLVRLKRRLRCRAVMSS
jgi:hypothetical protein